MKVSHEVPLCLLEESLTFNDYQYALVHLLEENKDYRNHFLWCYNNNVEIYLDNSAHELGQPVDDSLLIKWIKILEPSNVFVPDFIENKKRTIVEAKKWSQIEVPKNTTKVAIIQADSLQGAIESTQIYIDLGYKKIAFPYASSYYRQLVTTNNKNLGLALGRVKVIENIIKSKILNNNHKIHLLGTACPIEFNILKNNIYIESIDTSNPIMMSLENRKVIESAVYDKPKININNSFYIDKTKINLDLLQENINTFKNFLK
jgi:hypothetical protein